MPSYQWDDEIEDNGEGDNTFVLLAPGIYGAVCHEVKRGYSQQSQCPQAEVVWKVVSARGRTTLIDYINLSESVKWKILQLFRSVGFRKHGEPCKLQFNKLTGVTGWLKVDHRKYFDKNGAEKTANQISGYIPPEEVPVEVHADFEAIKRGVAPSGDLPF